MRLNKKNYNEFCEAFSLLAKLAVSNHDVRAYLYRLHNKITNGATSRIFREKELPLQYLSISQVNFSRYIRQHGHEKNLIKVD